MLFRSGDAKLVLAQVLEEVKRQAGSQGRPQNQQLLSEIKTLKEEWLAQWMPRFTSNETPINPYRVIWDIMQTIDLDNCIVTHESGSPREQVTPFWEARAPRSFIGWGKSTQLGYSLGLASRDYIILELPGRSDTLAAGRKATAVTSARNRPIHGRSSPGSLFLSPLRRQRRILCRSRGP